MRISVKKAIPGLTDARRAPGRRVALLRFAFRTIPPLVTLLLGLSSFARADDFWKQKPPAQWSHDQALKLVRRSPWAKVEVVIFLQRENQASFSVPTGTNHCDPDAIDANGNCLQKGRIEAPVDSSANPMRPRTFRPPLPSSCVGNRPLP